jgi:DNA-binding transcriptional MocR family regulator
MDSTPSASAWVREGQVFPYTEFSLEVPSMKELVAQPKLVEQVQEALLADISSGKLRAGERIIQEQIAQVLGVSRQPVQQALALLRNKGVLRDAPGAASSWPHSTSTTCRACTRCARCWRASRSARPPR